MKKFSADNDDSSRNRMNPQDKAFLITVLSAIGVLLLLIAGILFYFHFASRTHNPESEVSGTEEPLYDASAAEEPDLQEQGLPTEKAVNSRTERQVQKSPVPKDSGKMNRKSSGRKNGKMKKQEESVALTPARMADHTDDILKETAGLFFKLMALQPGDYIRLPGETEIILTLKEDLKHSFVVECTFPDASRCSRVIVWKDEYRDDVEAGTLTIHAPYRYQPSDMEKKLIARNILQCRNYNAEKGFAESGEVKDFFDALENWKNSLLIRNNRLEKMTDAENRRNSAEKTFNFRKQYADADILAEKLADFVKNVENLNSNDRIYGEKNLENVFTQYRNLLNHWEYYSGDGKELCLSFSKKYCLYRLNAVSRSRLSFPQNNKTSRKDQSDEQNRKKSQCMANIERSILTDLPQTKDVVEKFFEINPADIDAFYKKFSSPVKFPYLNDSCEFVNLVMEPVTVKIEQMIREIYTRKVERMNALSQWQELSRRRLRLKEKQQSEKEKLKDDEEFLISAGETLKNAKKIYDEAEENCREARIDLLNKAEAIDHNFAQSVKAQIEQKQVPDIQDGDELAVILEKCIRNQILVFRNLHP